MCKTAFGFSKHTLSCATVYCGSSYTSSSLVSAYIAIGQFITVTCAAWELVVIFLVAVIRVYCWSYRVWRKYEEPNLWAYLEYLRFGDLQITSFVLPFGNVSLFYGDMLWLIFGIIRLAFYVITFITDVVNGVRNDCCCSITSGRGNNLREIKKHWLCCDKDGDETD